MQIKDYNDLAAFINTLTEEQRKQKPMVAGHDGPSQPITDAAITEEPFLLNKHNEDDFGTESELRRMHGETFSIANYQEIAPKGEVFLYLE